MEGCGSHLMSHLRESFFECYNGIIYQLKCSHSDKEISFLLNSLIWKISTKDYPFIEKSGIVEVLTQGTGIEHSKKNTLKHTWGHQIINRISLTDKKLANKIVNALECIVVNVFSKIITSSDVEKNQLI
jgi:hypothetical protein